MTNQQLIDGEHVEYVDAKVSVFTRPLRVVAAPEPRDELARRKQEDIPGQAKTLTERLNEAYDEEAEREDEEFFRNTKTYYRRRFSAED